MDNVVALDPTNNFDSMAEAMGLATKSSDSNESTGSSLARLRIWHQSIMGTEQVKGKTRQVEVVPGGTYRLQDANGDFIYAEKISFKPFLQQFFYSRYVPYVKPDEQGRKGKFVKSVMVGQSQFGRDDLIDNAGTVNCGRPAGYIKNWGDLPEPQQKLIMSVKRVRALLGTVTLHDAVDNTGEPVTVQENTPVIWEIDNKDAFKTIGQAIDKFASNRRLLPQHTLELTTSGDQMANGNMIFKPVVDVDFTKTLPLGDEEKGLFTNFKTWVQNVNQGVKKSHDLKASSKMSQEDEDTVNSFIDITDAKEIA